MSFPEFTSTDDAGIRGVANAIVTENDDDLGRVKLTYPWRAADDESYWAKMAMPMAGPDRGTYFLPEVKDEVLVAFLDGDIEHPYVLGALWNERDPPPETNEGGDNDVRMIRSRSGHEFVMNDADGGGGVELRTSAGHEVLLDDADGGERVRITDSEGTNRVELDADGATISCDGDLTISAKTLRLESAEDVRIDADGSVRITGTTIHLN